MSLAIPEPSAAVVVQQYEMQNQAVARLSDWAQSALAAHEVATSLVQTSFVPEAFRGKPHEATAAILAGAEVGLSPMSSLRSFDVIQGTAAPRAITLRAIVQSQGHEMILVESTATRARMKGKRRGSAEWVEVVWTMDRAKDLGLANKPNWKNQPGTMLIARCTSELARLIAADAILGIGYTVEELTDGASTAQASASTQAPPQSEPVVSSTPSGTRRMSRTKRAPDVQPAPPAEQPELPANDPAPEVDGITAPQTKKMAAMMREAGITERQDALDYVALIIGRNVASRSELTKDEASQVIDALTEMAADDAASQDEESVPG